jgi:hypothetical protein
MKADTMTCVHLISNNGPFTEIPGVRAVYTSADVEHNPLSGDILQALDACRALNADVAAIESGDRVIVAAVNCYDNAYAVAVCDPGVLLPAIARGLQVRLFSLSIPDACPDMLPVATVRKSIGRWERKIAVVFGEQYAAGLVAALSPDVATTEAMETMRRKLMSAIGDCIDLSAVSPE